MSMYSRGGIWTNVEDEILKAAVAKYGLTQWSRCSSLLNRKTAKQCKSRWLNWLSPRVNKSEWSTKEEEKLLSLAKVLPNQWQTIAPIIGRTPNQCIERYQKLLDDVNFGDGEASGFDSDKTKAALLKTNSQAMPESMAARPDAIEMDDEEREMISEARARLANTQGKKAKRKNRERMLAQSRRVALLQKRRELKNVGMGINTTTISKKKKNTNEMDYNQDIAFEVKPNDNLYDTSNEDKKDLQALETFRNSLQKKRKFSKDEDEKKEKKHDKKRKQNTKQESTQSDEQILEDSDLSIVHKLILSKPKENQAPIDQLVRQYLQQSGILITSGLLAIARLLSCLIALILILVLLVGGSTKVSIIYTYKLEFSHINVAKGLYTALKSSSVNYSLDDGEVDPFQPDVTTAQIQILVEYLSDQFQGKPEFIVAGISRYCYGSYTMPNLTRQDLGRPFAHVPHSEKAVIVRCGSFYDEQFNYRQMLLAEGLDIILDYAYEGNIYSSKNLKPYQNIVNNTHILQKMLLAIPINVAIFQLIMLLLTIYNIKQRRKTITMELVGNRRKSSDMSLYNHTNSTNINPKLNNIDEKSMKKVKNDRFTLIINSILSTMSFIIYLALTIYFSAVFVSLRHQVNLELGNFGFRLLGGRIFITILWLVFLCLFFSVILWTGVLFLVVPNQVNSYDMDDELFDNSEYHDSNLAIIENREREHTYINQYSNDNGSAKVNANTSSTNNSNTISQSRTFSAGSIVSNRTSGSRNLKIGGMSKSAGNYRKSLQNLAAFAGEQQMSRNVSPTLAEEIEDINNMPLLNRNTSIGTNIFSSRNVGTRNMTLNLENAGYTENSTFLNTAGSHMDSDDQLKYYREPQDFKDETNSLKFKNPFEDP